MNYSHDQSQDSQLEALLYQTMKSNQPAAAPELELAGRDYLSPSSPSASVGDQVVSL